MCVAVWNYFVKGTKDTSSAANMQQMMLMMKETSFSVKVKLCLQRRQCLSLAIKMIIFSRDSILSEMSGGPILTSGCGVGVSKPVRTASQ